MVPSTTGLVSLTATPSHNRCETQQGQQLPRSRTCLPKVCHASSL